MKETKQLIMIAKELIAGEKLLAMNYSHWSWDDDSNSVDASIYVNDLGGLRLEIIETHTKSGLGAGTRTAKKEDVDLGTLEKPRLGMVKSLLKKHGHERTRAGYPFQRLWEDGETKEKLMLADIIAREVWRRKDSIKQEPIVDSISQKKKLMKLVENMSPEDIERVLGFYGERV